jgi:hypothetical protein
LNEAGTEVDIHLYQRRIADRLEAVNLTRLDYKNVSSAALEGFAVDRVEPRTSVCNGLGAEAAQDCDFGTRGISPGWQTSPYRIMSGLP